MGDLPDLYEDFASNLEKAADVLERNGYNVRGFRAYVPEYDELSYNDEDDPSRALDKLLGSLPEYDVIETWLDGRDLAGLFTGDPEAWDNICDSVFERVRGEVIIDDPTAGENDIYYGKIDYIPDISGGHLNIHRLGHPGGDVEAELTDILEEGGLEVDT